MNFIYEPTEFVLNLQGRHRAQCILHQCIPVNMRLFTPVFKDARQFCFQCIGIADMFYSFCLRKVLDMVVAVVAFDFPKLFKCNKNILHSTFNFWG
jgi:hypothetical protein